MARLCSIATVIGVMLVAFVWRAPAADAPAPGAPVPAAPTSAPSARAAVEPMIGEMVNLAGEGRIDQMLDRIGSTPEPDREAIERARESLMAVYNNAGKYRGYDIAGFKTLTPRFQVAFVLAYFDRRPVMFEIGFYQVEGKWRPQTLTVERDFRAVLDAMPLEK